MPGHRADIGDHLQLDRQHQIAGHQARVPHRAALRHFQLVGGIAGDVLALHFARLGIAAVMLPAAGGQLLLAGIGELQIVAVTPIEHRNGHRAIAAGAEAPLDQEIGGQRVHRIARRRGAAAWDGFRLHFRTAAGGRAAAEIDFVVTLAAVAADIGGIGLGLRPSAGEPSARRGMALEILQHPGQGAGLQVAGDRVGTAGLLDRRAVGRDVHAAHPEHLDAQRDLVGGVSGRRDQHQAGGEEATARRQQGTRQSEHLLDLPTGPRHRGPAP